MQETYKASNFIWKKMNCLFPGLIATVAMQVVHENQLVGVVGIDITMADLLEDVTYFNPGQSSYAFLMDNRGRTMMHPLLPR